MARERRFEAGVLAAPFLVNQRLPFSLHDRLTVM